MKKRRIVIASVLKPIDDPRMYEKMGCSLAREGYEVIIVGFPSRREPEMDCGVELVPHRRQFSRLGLARILAPARLAIRLLRLRPELLIVCTHELLEAAVVCKIMAGSRVIYDIQENYYTNALYSGSFRGILRLIVGSLVRLREKWWSRWCDAFIVAEERYTRELPFLHRAPTEVVRNKLSDFWVHHFAPGTGRGYHRLLFSGTLSDTTGVFAAIELAKGLHALDPSIKLTIAGYCARKDEFARLCREVNSNSYVSLKGGDTLLPHAEVMRLIHASDFGLVLYEMTPAFASSVPTKLYEYLGMRLPMLARKGFGWASLIADARAGILYDEDFDFGWLLDEMKRGTFYPRDHAGQVTWSTEAPGLAGMVGRVLSSHLS